MQRPCGDRIKTDARDALHLARLLRLGQITPVRVPTEIEESARDLVRTCDGTQAAFEDAHPNVVPTTTRRARLDTKIIAMAADSPFTDLSHRLACLRGISTLTAFSLAVEIGEWDRRAVGSRPDAPRGGARLQPYGGLAATAFFAWSLRRFGQPVALGWAAAISRRLRKPASCQAARPTNSPVTWSIPSRSAALSRFTEPP